MNYFSLFIAESYYDAGETKSKRDDQPYDRLYGEDLQYYFSFTGRRANALDNRKQEGLASTATYKDGCTDAGRTGRYF
jgi:hypothetical protein